MRISIGGKEFSVGRNLRIVGGRVSSDGEEIIVEGLTGARTNEITLEIIGGSIGELTTDASVNCDDVTGNVTAGGSVNCDNIGGSVNARGSVNSDSVGGNIDAGGSVNCGPVKGSIKAGGSVFSS
jgi:hypothetical protein